MFMTSTLIQNFTWLKQMCPACGKPLASGKTTTGYAVWCPQLDCNKMADGPNDGGHGKSVDKAYNTLLAKLGLNKNYQSDFDDAPDDQEDSPTKVEKTNEPKKVSNKRGRNPKVTGPFTIPVGQFTMTEFCTANETYPYKALPFFKEKGIVEVGKRPNANGRGKQSVLYAVKN
jgi:hypothetical protein